MHAASLQGYSNGPATQGSALFGASQLPSQDDYSFTQDMRFTQDGAPAYGDYPQFTGFSQVRPSFLLQITDACCISCLPSLPPLSSGGR